MEHPLPQNHFYSIEYPGYVSSTSVPRAIHSLGGQSTLDTAFKRNASKTECLLELNLRPGNPFVHPVPGDVCSTNNILMKVVRRRKRRVVGQVGCDGEYTADVVGVIPKTARFRSMVDYQFLPDMNDPIAKLRLAMDRMDVDAIRKYTIPPEQEDYSLPLHVPSMNLDPEFQPAVDQIIKTRSNLRMFPPPVFSRQGIPQNYNFKANPASMVSTTVDEETGQEKKRLINRMRWKGYGPASIMFTDPVVPHTPPQTVEEMRDAVDQRILKDLQNTFAERPVWTRMSLFNQFSASDTRAIHNSKILLPMVCYVFQDGPWRDTLVRFNYDPRKDTNARFYQRLYFRNANHPIEKPSVVTRRQERQVANMQAREEGSVEQRQSHIFDGVSVTKETAAFQLCDIVDPMLKQMIEEDSDLREVCHERDGWFTTTHFERIKTVLRHKFFSLLQGHMASEEECLALLEPVREGSTKVRGTTERKLRVGKHNMAKGALRPEDAAALRLRGQIEKTRYQR